MAVTDTSVPVLRLIPMIILIHILCIFGDKCSCIRMNSKKNDVIDSVLQDIQFVLEIASWERLAAEIS